MRQKAIGTKIQQARTENGLTLERFAELSGVPTRIMESYELGETPLPIPELMFTSTPTVAPVAGDGIGIGMYVQILGTGGDGLRLRSGAGMSYDPIFLGMEAEVFEVMDGPREGDGYMWWFLKAPYDPNRKGWARSDYLSVVSTSQNP
ncbi:MAG TPA: helix-turn-helix domain-containing protein, partial [Anaerolineaceae bacterium]|nr:helix-turn-helix domain-containing protein [Anaerolineaceae bacterium]